MVRVYVDHRGVRYRVHDAVYGVPPAAPFKRMQVPLGDPRATVRYFKPETGDTLVHQFTKGDSRELTEAALIRQVRTAGILGKHDRAFNPQASPPPRPARYDEARGRAPPDGGKVGGKAMHEGASCSQSPEGKVCGCQSKVRQDAALD